MSSNRNRTNANLSSIKMQAANEVGVPLKDKGYNGDLTARQAGSVGGQMVKKMIESYESSNGLKYGPSDNEGTSTAQLNQASVQNVQNQNMGQ